MNKRIGIYGGTFSPVHNGHILMAKSFLEQMKLDLLYIIPTAVPPHKAEVQGASTEDRLKMLKLAFGNMSKVTVSDIEIKRGNKSYTVDTLRSLEGEGELFLLCGSDMFLTFETWKSPDEIFKRSHIVLGRRENSSETESALEDYKKILRDRYGASIHDIAFEPVTVSSSDIRRKIAAHEDISFAVPEAVEEYIKNNRLYENA